MATTPRSHDDDITQTTVQAQRCRHCGGIISSAFSAPPNPPRPHLPQSNLLHPVQELDTSGARAVAPFELDGTLYLAIPQLAQDIEGQAVHMNAGDSDVSLIVYRHQPSGFVEYQRLPVSGGEDAEFFRIGDRSFLATASIRSGRGPYSFNVDSTIFEWREGRFERFQSIPTFAAKQWRHFKIGERTFLALAQGISLDNVTATNPSSSMIFEWDGNTFRPFQSIPSAWGYNWRHFSMSAGHFLAYADHMLPSTILRWSGAAFEPFQTLEGKGGRAFLFFADKSEAYLAFAKILGDTLVYRWNGTSLRRTPDLKRSGRPRVRLSGAQRRALCDPGEFHHRHAGQSEYRACSPSSTASRPDG